MNRLKRRSSVALNSKKVVALIAILAMLATIFLVKLVKSTNIKDNELEDAVLLEEAMKGKKAVSMLFDISELPVEMLYPGVKVDVVDRSSSVVESLVNGVKVIGLSYLPDRGQAKVFVAVNEDEGLRILGASDKKLGVVIVGDGPSNEDDIEIIEF